MKKNMIYKLAASANLEETKAMEIEKIIQDHSLAAAATAAAAGLMPGAIAAIAGIVCKGFTWTMLFRICLTMGVDVNKESLKSFASAITAKVAAYLGVVLAGGMLLYLIPGLGYLGASALTTVLGYVMVYASGLLFLGMMAQVVTKTGENMTGEEVIHQLKNEAISDEDIARAAKAAVKTYAEAKKENANPAAASV